MRFATSIFLCSAAIFGFVTAGFQELAIQLPQCGLLCLGTAISQSPCAISNATCICTDAALTASATACLTKSCTVREQFKVARIQGEGCGVPVVSKQTKIRVIVYVFCILAELCVIVRLWTRMKIMNRLDPADWVIVFAGIASIPFAYLVLTGADLGLGLNIWDADADNLDHFFKLFVITEIVYLVLLGATKLALLLFLVKIFPSRLFRVACWTIGALTTAITISFVMATILSCRPISYAWTRWQGPVTKGTCNNTNLQTYIAGGINVIQDFTILLLPLPEVYKLKVSFKKKIQLFFMFGVGFLVSIISIVRLRYLVTYGNTKNPTMDYVNLVAWSVIEPMLAIICACMPSIRQLLGHFFPEGFSSTAKSSYGTSRNGEQRIYQSRSFKIENKLRSHTDDFHELTNRTTVAGRDSSSDHHTPGNLNNFSRPESQLPNFNRHEDEETGTAHGNTENSSTHESVAPLHTKGHAS